MCEESTCLVPPLEQSQNGPAAEPSISSTASNSVSIGGEALVGFHEDALSQAQVGKAQLLLTLVLGLAIIADCSELSILGYILPAAELQLCIDDHRKGWLVSITLLSMAIGSIAWGILGDRIGRRRALASSLSVAGLFSAVATVMPTYGTFMTARFCSGFGISGAVPLAFSYLSETCPRATRTRYTGLLYSFWPLGALLTSTMAHLTLPSDGSEVVEDNREHWSSWHKFLILNILPTFSCVVCLIWTSESPRYLLEASREVEALEVYQRLHRLNKSRTQYGLTELELPGRSAYRDRPVSPSPTSSRLKHGMKALVIFKESIQRIISPTHYKTTILLASIHLLLGFTYMGMTTFSTSKIKEMNDHEFRMHKKHIINANYTGTTFNLSVENVQYKDTLFKNVTFYHIEFNHAEFVGCTFDESEFSNVKSSITYFYNSTIKDTRFVDTDFTDHHFVNCKMINNTFLSLLADCKVDFDFNIYLDDFYQETIAWAGPMVPALLIIGFILETTLRPPIVVLLLVVASLSGIGIFFISTFTSILIVEALFKVLVVCALNTITMVIIEAYPCYLRCTAHGIMRSLFHISSLCAIPIYSFLVHTLLLFPAVMVIFTTFIAALLSSRMQDNSKVLI